MQHLSSSLSNLPSPPPPPPRVLNNRGNGLQPLKSQNIYLAVDLRQHVRVRMAVRPFWLLPPLIGLLVLQPSV